MIPNKHYIAYKGGYIDLQIALAEALYDLKKLNFISENGYQFANKNFRSDVVYENFLNQLT